MRDLHGAGLVLIAHTFIAILLIGAGAVLVGFGHITQETYLAMVSGSIGLLSGGGTALALQNSLKTES